MEYDAILGCFCCGVSDVEIHMTPRCLMTALVRYQAGWSDNRGFFDNPWLRRFRVPSLVCCFIFSIFSVLERQLQRQWSGTG
jgi:hypothetical protein